MAAASGQRREREETEWTQHAPVPGLATIVAELASRLGDERLHGLSDHELLPS